MLETTEFQDMATIPKVCRNVGHCGRALNIMVRTVTVPSVLCTFWSAILTTRALLATDRKREENMGRKQLRRKQRRPGSSLDDPADGSSDLRVGGRNTTQDLP